MSNNIKVFVFLASMVAFIKPLHSEPRIIVTDAFIVDKQTLFSNLSATWATIESRTSYPTSLHPYDDGYRYYDLLYKAENTVIRREPRIGTTGIQCMVVVELW